MSEKVQGNYRRNRNQQKVEPVVGMNNVPQHDCILILQFTTIIIYQVLTICDICFHNNNNFLKLVAMSKKRRQKNMNKKENVQHNMYL